MKGFVSIIFALFLAVFLLQAFKLKAESGEKTFFYESKALALEKKYYVDQDVKSVFRQVLASAEGKTAVEKASDAAKKLSDFESFAEKHFSDKGIKVDLWVGAVTQEEIDSLNKKMLEEGKALKCRNCFDLNSESLDANGLIVLNAKGLLSLDEEVNVIVSRNGLIHAPFLSTRLLNGRIGFGASYYFVEEKIAAVSLVPEGFP